MERADLVVVGTVKEISEGSSFRHDLTISAEENLKGSGGSAFTIRGDSLSEAACSPFDPKAVGKTYLLFLRGDQDHLRTDICAGSTEIDPDHMPSVVEEIRQIVAGTALATETRDGDDLAATQTPLEPGFPASGTGGSASAHNRAWLVTGVAAVAALGLAGAGVAWRGARRG